MRIKECGNFSKDFLSDINNQNAILVKKPMPADRRIVPVYSSNRSIHIFSDYPDEQSVKHTQAYSE